MKILGLDPGTTRVGYGLLEKGPKGTRLLDYGCFFFEKTSPARRPYEIFKRVGALLSKAKPDLVAVEQVFFSKNKKTAMAVSEARGAILVAIAAAAAALRSYSPSRVKLAVGATATGGKKGVQKMVRLLLGLKKDPQPDDAADALAIAICCAAESPQPAVPKDS